MPEKMTIQTPTDIQRRVYITTPSRHILASNEVLSLKVSEKILDSF
jgi:hypothetical protein